jgi:hypothetical protein
MTVNQSKGGIFWKPWQRQQLFFKMKSLQKNTDYGKRYFKGVFSDGANRLDRH